MSDNDLIRRGDVINVICEMHVGGKDAIEHALPNTYAEDLREIIYEVDDIPAVPREMSAAEYLETEARMCKYYGLPCAFDVSGLTVDEAISMVEKFAREHPEERSEE